jgi:hypothetical protein
LWRPSAGAAATAAALPATGKSTPREAAYQAAVKQLHRQLAAGQAVNPVKALAQACATAEGRDKEQLMGNCWGLLQVRAAQGRWGS